MGRFCLAAEAPPTFASLFGVWKVKPRVGASPVTANQKAADAALGTTVTISADLISTYEKSGGCKPRGPTVAEADTEAKLEGDFGTTGAGLYLPARSLKPRMPFMDAEGTHTIMIERDWRQLFDAVEGFLTEAEAGAS